MLKVFDRSDLVMSKMLVGTTIEVTLRFPEKDSSPG